MIFKYLEEEILGPHYLALGEAIKFGHTFNHEYLLELMAKVADEISSFFEFSQCLKRVEPPVTNDEKNTMMEKQISLKVTFYLFKSSMFHHLEEEERFWPAVFKKYGEKAHDSSISKIVSHGLQLKGKVTMIIEIHHFYYYYH